jgi:hypothetical protein
MRRLLALLLIAPIRGYQLLISPLLPPMCRFSPTCSNYTLEAIRMHGPFYGSWLGARRIARCHPFNPGGFDPVPPLRGAPTPLPTVTDGDSQEG